MRTDRPVVLVDADLQFGDIAVMLKLAPQHTIVDAVELDRPARRRAPPEPARHPPAVGAQGAARRRSSRRSPTRSAPTTSRKIVEILRTFCAYVVIDTPAYFNDVVLSLIEMSDDVLLVAGMDIPNIKNVKIGLQTLRLLNTPMSKIHLVLNRANSKVKLDVERGRAHAAGQGRGARPERRRRAAVGQQGHARGARRPEGRRVAKALEQLADLFVPAAEKGRRKK